MSNMHRITWFDGQVRTFNYPNRETLAKKFEISTRQAQRDIDYLKETMGAPLKYDPKRRGYIYEDDIFILPNIYITEEVKRMLEFLAYNYSNYSRTPKAAQMAELFKKLTRSDEIDDDIHVFDLDKPTVQVYYKIHNSIKSSCKLILSYKDPQKGIVKLEIHPYKVFHKYRADYVVCYCEETQDIRTLRLDRVQDIEETDKKFKISPEYNDNKYSSFVKNMPYTARIKFSREPVFQNPIGINIKPVEGYTYDIEFYETSDFINQLIGIDYWESIYSPKWLKQKLMDRCTGIINKLDL